MGCAQLAPVSRFLTTALAEADPTEFLVGLTRLRPSWA
jgi:hypothetical protein